MFCHKWLSHLKQHKCMYTVYPRSISDNQTQYLSSSNQMIPFKTSYNKVVFVSTWDSCDYHEIYFTLWITMFVDIPDRLCGLVVRVSGCRSRGPGFYSRRYHIFWEVVRLRRGPLNLVSTTEELRERRGSGSGLESRESAALTTWHPSIRKSWH
jgi:hypothetical protein